MRGEGKSQKDGQSSESDKKLYFFRRCPSCGVKMHIYAYYCWKCGGLYNYNAAGKGVEDVVFQSENPDDADCCAVLNDVEMCFTCRNTQNGRPCRPARCFGFGNGSCGDCSSFEYARFECCQGVQKREAGAKPADVNAILRAE